MSMYPFAPSPDKTTNECLYAFWNDGFSSSELKNIIKIGEGCSPDNGEISVGDTKEEFRSSQISWIAYNNKTSWLYDRMSLLSRHLNGQFFDYDLYGFVEDFQYTVYDKKGDHYNWHMDKSKNTPAPRKLSLVLQLSDPSEYEGGDLEIFTSIAPIKLEKKKGMLCAFPSFVMHRVTPVTRGIRKTLVVWVSGPKFK